MADDKDVKDDVEEADESSPSPEETPEEPTEEPEAPSTDEPETPAEPEESAEAESPEEEEPAEPRLSRKERREERKQAFLESVRREQAQTPPTPPQEEYDPLDYSKPDSFSEPETGYIKPDILQKDREAYAKAEAQKAAQAERFRAEQEKFLDNIGHESDRLKDNPKYSFLDDKSEDFDEEKTGTINELFLATAGYDPQTKTFRDTSLSYKKFVERFMDTVEDWTGDQTAETAKKMAAAKSRQGVRPTAAKKGPSIATPEDIAKLTPEQYKKLKPQIEAQANRLFEQAS